MQAWVRKPGGQIAVRLFAISVVVACAGIAVALVQHDWPAAVACGLPVVAVTLPGTLYALALAPVALALALGVMTGAWLAVAASALYLLSWIYLACCYSRGATALSRNLIWPKQSGRRRAPWRQLRSRCRRVVVEARW